MIKNGFTPEWIRLSKEIKDDIEELENKLIAVRNNLTEPMNQESEAFWNKNLDNFRETEKSINNKIEKYNFLVPIIQKQRFKINLQKIAEAILAKPCDPKIKVRKNRENYLETRSDKDVIGSLISFFSKRTS